MRQQYMIQGLHQDLILQAALTLPGPGLARLESALVFERLPRCFHHSEPAGEAVRDTRSPFRTNECVPLAADPNYLPGRFV